MSKATQTITRLPTSLCRLQDIEDPGCREYTIRIEPEHEQAIFLVRQGEQVFGYINSCPHTLVALNWQPEVFLNLEKDYIQCGTHGALFRIEDGYCVRGPCSGASLLAIPVRISSDGQIRLESMP